MTGGGIIGWYDSHKAVGVHVRGDSTGVKCESRGRGGLQNKQHRVKSCPGGQVAEVDGGC